MPRSNPRPRNAGAAQLARTMTGEWAIFVNAHAIGGSVVRVSPREARKIGKRLIEMADWMEARRHAAK